MKGWPSLEIKARLPGLSNHCQRKYKSKLEPHSFSLPVFSYLSTSFSPLLPHSLFHTPILSFSPSPSFVFKLMQQIVIAGIYTQWHSLLIMLRCLTTWLTQNCTMVPLVLIQTIPFCNLKSTNHLLFQGDQRRHNNSSFHP